MLLNEPGVLPGHQGSQGWSCSVTLPGSCASGQSLPGGGLSVHRQVTTVIPSQGHSESPDAPTTLQHPGQLLLMHQGPRLPTQDTPHSTQHPQSLGIGTRHRDKDASILPQLTSSLDIQDEASKGGAENWFTARFP